VTTDFRECDRDGSKLCHFQMKIIMFTQHCIRPMNSRDSSVLNTPPTLPRPDLAKRPSLESSFEKRSGSVIF